MIIGRSIFLLVLMLYGLTGWGQNRRHVVVISIDGLRPEFYLDKSWPAPNIQKLCESGSYAKRMISVFPSYTYPAHVAMVTGALPARSGICFNVKDGKEWNWYTKEVRVPTIWEIAEGNGLVTASIQWPVSVGAKVRYNFPEIWGVGAPNDRFSESKKYATPGLLEELEQYATGKLDSNSMDEATLALDDNTGRIAAYIFRTKKPNLMTVHFAGVDGRQHEFGMDHKEVRIALSNVDNAIGRMLESIEKCGIKDDVTILVVGDHGFCDIKKVVRPNYWIKQLNCKFRTAGGSAFLYANHKSEPVDSVKVISILEALPVPVRSCFRVVRRGELDQLGVDSQAVLALAANPGVVFGESVLGKQLDSISGGHHGYHPALAEMYTGFIAYGVGIKKHFNIEELHVSDLAPLLAHLLGVKIGLVDGKLVDELLVSAGEK